jgi:putative membrane protein
MTRFFLRWGINALGLFAAVRLVNGISLPGAWYSVIWLALIFGLINALLRPLLKILTCPLILLTLGLFTLVLNTFLFWLTSVIGRGVGIPMTIAPPTFWNAFLGALIVSLVSIAMSLIFRDELKKR